MPGLLQVNALLCRDQLSNPEPPLMLPQRERLWPTPAISDAEIYGCRIAALWAKPECLLLQLIMTVSQVNAARILLNRVCPALKAVEVTGDMSYHGDPVSIPTEYLFSIIAGVDSRTQQ